MNTNDDKYIITAALPYANGPLHIGHIAGVYLPADIYNRYLKRRNKDVIFISGSDEHGIPITIKALKEKKSPEDIINVYHSIIKKSFKDLDINFDIYSRTSSENHKKTSRTFFKNLYFNDLFLDITSEQYYDDEKKEFLADRYITGTCPKCNNTNAYGDQCEKCGIDLSPDELINPKSSISGTTPIKKYTTNSYMKLDKFQSFLDKWVSNKKNIWKYNVYSQVKSWLDNGLKPRAMTRDLKWGVEINIKGFEGKVLYVWFEAPIGYISFTKEWSLKNNKNWQDYWKNKNTKLIHFIGKDNIVFHCIIFPSMLKAHGDFILPYNVPANEFLNLEGKKISTSRNWAIWINEFVNDFPNKSDVLRYVLCSNMPENKDNNFTWKEFQIKNNSELVGILGNFINRVLHICKTKYFNIVPETYIQFSEIYEINNICKKIGYNIEKYHFRDAINLFLEISRIGNAFLQKHEPWKKDYNSNEIKSVINLSIQIVYVLGQVADIFMPKTSKKILNIINCEIIDWVVLENSNNFINSGHLINDSELLFDKISNDEISKQINKLKTIK